MRRDDCAKGSADSRSENLAIVAHAGRLSGLSAERGVARALGLGAGVRRLYAMVVNTGACMAKGEMHGVPLACICPRQISEPGLGLTVLGQPGCESG